MLFDYFFYQWRKVLPIFSWSMSNSGLYPIGNLFIKGLEISVILLYIVDLLPKILVWKKPLYWKMLNAVVVTLMVIQMPITLREYIEMGISLERLKLRIFSIGLSFLLLCEILSIREQRTLKWKSNFYSPKPVARGGTPVNRECLRMI